MTYITGFRNQTSVFIVADSAITYEKESLKNAKIWSDVSTFGEAHIIQEDKIIQEKWLKIYNFDDNLILAFAGNVGHAYEAINSLEVILENPDRPDIRNILKYICRSKEISIIAGFIENEQPVLISVNSNGNIGFKEHSIYEGAFSGTIDNSFINHTQEFYDQIQNVSYIDEQILVSMCSVIQSYKYVKETIPNGVGGFISGIRVDKLGVSWQKDITYIPVEYNGTELDSFQLSDLFGEAETISVLLRDNLAFVSNPYTHWRYGRRLFGNYYPSNIFQSEDWKKGRDSWANNWSQSVHTLIDEFTYDYYVFISKSLPIVISIFSKEYVLEKQIFRYVRYFRGEQETQSLLFNPESLDEFLFTILIPEDDDFTIKCFF